MGTSSGQPGVLIGRYPGDTYAGGNPWVLSTAALAQLLYRAATFAHTATPDADTLAVWSEALNVPNMAAMDSATVASTFAAASDGVMLRLRKHVVARQFHL